MMCGSENYCFAGYSSRYTVGKLTAGETPPVIKGQNMVEFFVGLIILLIVCHVSYAQGWNDATDRVEKLADTGEMICCNKREEAIYSTKTRSVK